MDETGITSLLELNRDGTLAAEWIKVRSLLAETTGTAFAQAGQLLARLDPDQVKAHHPDVPEIRVTITGHGNPAMLIPSLTAELARHGLLLRATTTDFDAYTVELADPGSSVYTTPADAVLLLLDPMVVLDDLPTPWTVDDVATAIEHRIGLIEDLVIRFIEHSGAALVINTIPLLRRFSAQLVDQRSRVRLGILWREANTRLLRLAEAHPQVLAVDLDPLLSEEIAACEPRLSVYVRAHLSAPLLAAYAREIGHLIRSVTGRTKKCLALDLDGTLWGGVLGDDGMEGIEIGEGLRPEAFAAFQRLAKQLASQGVLLAAVSKNDLGPVQRVFREHPGMVLREDDLVQIRADWEAKPGHLRALAEDLGIGLDSVVFVDDSPHECGLVRHECPVVDVVQLDPEPALHIEKLLADGWFDVRAVTAEDLERTAMYRAEAGRADARARSTGARDYLTGLGITVTLGAMMPADVARVSQLTLRTNQFNLTTRRLPPGDLGQFVTRPGAQVLTVHVADRFGSSGLTGVVFLERDGDGLRIENFLLSCRVLARGVEGAVLAAVLDRAAGSGVSSVEAEYRSTAKNAKVRDLYPAHGFETLTSDDTGATFRHSLLDRPQVPAHITLLSHLGQLDLEGSAS